MLPLYGHRTSGLSTFHVFTTRLPEYCIIYASVQWSNWGGTRGKGVPLPLFEGERRAPALMGGFRDTTRDSETEPHWTLWNTEKPTSSTGLNIVFNFRGGPDPLSRGSAPGPRLGIRPQTPIKGSLSRARHSGPLGITLTYKGVITKVNIMYSNVM